MKQFILKIPEGETVDNFSEEILEAIKSVSGQFPRGAIVGSKAVSGYELKLIMANATTEQIETLILAFDLDWEILAESGVESDSSLILPYMNDVIDLDEDGDLVSTTPFNISALQTYAGKSWLWL